MKKHFYLPAFSSIFLLMILFISNSVFAQSRFPQKALNDLSKQSLTNKKQVFTEKTNHAPQQASGVLQMMKKEADWSMINLNALMKSKSPDTLIVGAVPHDSLIITGNYIQNGPIFVLNDGLLRFKNANATILGDIYVFGDSARLYADSSYLYIPQQYFYQRALVVGMHGLVQYNNTTLDHSGLSNNLSITDSGRVEMNNVYNIGFTTNGLWSKASIDINGTNQAGEYIMTHQADLHFRHATTILLWHHLPDTSIINISFPANDTVYHYVFNDTVAGVSGIPYSVRVDTCYDLMWGLMPENGSDATITNSQIRTIGFWFKGNATSNVSGLVDNSNYVNFTAPLSDRNLHLINSSVQTWSIYPMDGTVVNLSSCIVGEVGAEQHSRVNGNGVFCDGSGGYFWSNDTSLVIAGFSSFTSNVRSEGNSFLIFAYSSMTNGIATALDKSVLFVIQSALPQDPYPLDASCVWFANINQPNSAFVDDSVDVIGSAWIDKTPISTLMDFGFYKLYYQIAGDTLWHLFKQATYQEVHNGTLGMWNTMGLAPGNYNIKVTLTDNYADSAEAIKSVNLQPLILSSTDQKNNYDFINVFPNPAANSMTISYAVSKDEEVSICLYDILGKKIKQICNSQKAQGKYSETIYITGLSDGMYILEIKAGETKSAKRFAVIKSN